MIDNVIAHEISVMINKTKVRIVCKDSIITFVKEGEQHKTVSKKYNKSGILQEAKDWVMETNEGLLKDWINAGWKVHLFTIEVGAHGYAACLLRSCLSRLGFIQRIVRDIIKKASEAELRFSFWIWLKRMDH